MAFPQIVEHISNFFSRRTKQPPSAQAAYHLLQRGVARWREKGRLLTGSELRFIELSQSRMVLSAPERELVKESRQALNRRRQRQSRIGIAVVALLLLGFTLQALWPLAFHPDGAWLEKSIALPTTNTFEGGQTPPSKKQERRVNQSPVKNAEEPSTNILHPEPPAEAPASPPVRPSPDTYEEKEAPATSTSPAQGAEVAVPPKPAAKRFVSENSHSEAVSTDFGEVLIVEDDQKWGLADSDGQYILAPEYDYIQAFHARRGLFLIEQNGKRGIAQARGQIVLYPFFEQIKSYYLRDALLIVSNEGKYGVYDERRKKFSLGLEYKDICCYSEGLFGVQTTNGKWGFVEKTGRVVVTPEFDTIEEGFEEGRALVKKGSLKYFIDKEGNVFPYNG